MSYDLDLLFTPTVKSEELKAYFRNRAGYFEASTEIIYENDKTGVYFLFRIETKARSLLLERRISRVRIEISYIRPRFFGLEAETEISEIVRIFPTRIDDKQIDGMGRGPYKGQGFLDGWNRGNAFAVKAMYSRDQGRKFPAAPAKDLLRAWKWNYNITALAAQQFAPRILFMMIDDKVAQFVIWGEGVPALLPKVDYVLVGRQDGERKVYGLAQWQQVVEVAASVGIDTQNDPLNLNYQQAPKQVAEFVHNIPEWDLVNLTVLKSDSVLDADLFD